MGESGRIERRREKRRDGENNGGRGLRKRRIESGPEGQE